MTKKLTLKELNQLQDDALNALSAGTSRGELVEKMLGEGIDDLTAQRIADSAEARVRRESEEELPKPKLFNYGVIMGGVFFALGAGVVGYTSIRPQDDNTLRIVGGLMCVWGLVRLIMAAMARAR